MGADVGPKRRARAQSKKRKKAARKPKLTVLTQGMSDAERRKANAQFVEQLQAQMFGTATPAKPKRRGGIEAVNDG